MDFNTFDNREISFYNIQDLSMLKKRAEESPERRARICLHESPDQIVHLMIIAMCKDSYVQPHRHPAGKPESYQMIEGLLDVLFFDDRGNIIRRTEMGAPETGKTFIYRQSGRIWHRPAPRTELVLFCETFRGPFFKEQDVEYAEWTEPERY